MICCSRRHSQSNNLKAEMNRLEEITRFNQQELAELQTRFARMSKNSNFITRNQFRDNLGLLGLGTMLYLSDRIFDIMDQDRDGKIRFQDFAEYFDHVCYGDAKEKAEISYKLIDRKKLGHFTFVDFNNTMQGMINSWVAMTGQHLTEEVKKQLDSRIHQIFEIMDKDKQDLVTLEKYQKSIMEDPNLLEIFDFIKRGMQDMNQFEIQNIDNEQHQVQQIRQIEQKMQVLLNFMTTQPEIVKKERFSSYKKQKTLQDQQQLKIPHFVGDQDQVEQGPQQQQSRLIDESHSPIINILQYDVIQRMSLPSKLDQQQQYQEQQYQQQQQQYQQFPSFQQNQILDDNISPHSLSYLNVHQSIDKDFSFQFIKRAPLPKQQPQFCQVPQKVVDDLYQIVDEMNLSDISENQSVECQQFDEKAVKEFINQAPENVIKEKYLNVLDCLKDLNEEVKMLRMQIDQEKYNKQRKETQIQFKEINLNQLRASTKGNIHKDRPNSKAKKPKISVSFGHENFNLVLNMMIGIQKAVNSINMTDDYEIGHKDFKLKYYFELLPRRAQSDKSSFKVCQFFDYAPQVFNSIRTIHGIDNQSYLKSIGPESLLQSLLKGDLSTLQELTSTGKSGSFFYYTGDGRFTLKTVHKHEFRFLKQIMESYYAYIKDNTDSLIIKFFGMHKIGIKFQALVKKEKVVYFVIMSNVFSMNQEIHVRYDLKGSLFKRETQETDPAIAKKDLNFLRDKQQLNVVENKKIAFLQQLEKDCEWFAKENIIDYSLLVGIHNKSLKQFDNESLYSEQLNLDQLHIISSINQEKTFYFGIIDILTNFSTKKKLEYLTKRVCYGPTISAIPPQDYSHRFIDFMRKYLFQN